MLFFKLVYIHLYRFIVVIFTGTINSFLNCTLSLLTPPGLGTAWASVLNNWCNNNSSKFKFMLQFYQPRVIKKPWRIWYIQLNDRNEHGKWTTHKKKQIIEFNPLDQSRFWLVHLLLDNLNEPKPKVWLIFQRLVDLFSKSLSRISLARSKPKAMMPLFSTTSYTVDVLSQPWYKLYK